MANELAWGFVDLRHLWAERVTEIGASVFSTAVNESAAQHTAALNALMANFVDRTTDRTRRVLLPGAGTLQPLDEHGNPLPVRPEGFYEVAFPIQGGGTAWGDNRVTRALMTVEEANRFTVDALTKDRDWMQRHILAAILDENTWTYGDPQGDITIQPLANGDSVTYNFIGGTTATDDHYIAQAAAIADATNPFPVIHTELSEHPGNTGPFVAYIASNLVTDTEALLGFDPVSDPDILAGNASDTLTGTLDRGVGDEVLGKASKMWIVEWRALPDNYIIAHARGAGSPLAMREYPAGELQGFFPEMHNVDGNHMVNRMIRYSGFGVQNRVSAVAYFVEAGDTTYDVPASFDAPLAI